MAKQKFYAVKQGRTPGIYFTWDDCKAQVDKYAGAKYQSFGTIEDAYAYIEKKEEQSQVTAEAPTTDKGIGVVPNLEHLASQNATPYAFVDGSFNPETKVYGYGGFLDVGGRRYPLMGSGNDPEMASMRNVAGEIEGSMAAVQKAEELSLREIKLLYDYRGIEEWATGKWQANKAGTMAYRDFMNPDNRQVQVTFEKVAAHTGIEGNEMADVMAKNAVGIKLTKSQQKLFDEAISSGSRDGLDISGIHDIDVEKEIVK